MIYFRVKRTQKYENMINNEIFSPEIDKIFYEISKISLLISSHCSVNILAP